MLQELKKNNATSMQKGFLVSCTNTRGRKARAGKVEELKLFFKAGKKK